MIWQRKREQRDCYWHTGEIGDERWNELNYVGKKQKQKQEVTTARNMRKLNFKVKPPTTIAETLKYEY